MIGNERETTEKEITGGNDNGAENFGISNTRNASNSSVTEMNLECTEEMPILSSRVQDHNVASNIKRRRVLPPMFLAPPLPPLPEDNASDTDEFRGDHETLCRMRMAVQIIFSDLEDREAERMRELRDFNEGDTPRTSQESSLSDYNWSAREGGDLVPLDEIMQFIWKYLARQRVYSRVAVFASLTEEMFEEDPDRVKGTVAHVLNCEPVVLLNTLEDAIEIAENIFQADGEDESDVETEHLAD
jgi:hypothetical protein